jgi:polyphosphate kinase
MVAADAHALMDEQYAVFNDELMPLLARERIVILNHTDRDEAQRRWVDQFFARQVRPLLVPVGLDPAHPFPQVANKSLNFIARLTGLDAFGRENTIAIVKVPRVLPRVIKLPQELTPGRQAFVLLTSVIRSHLGELFPGREVEAFSQFRVTRDSDLGSMPTSPTCARRCAPGSPRATSARPSGWRWWTAARPSCRTSCWSSSASRPGRCMPPRGR